VTTEFNIEGYPSDDFINLIHEINPDQVTLVPDPPDVLTSNAGWKILKQQNILKSAIASLKGSRVSVFVDPETCTVEDLKCLSDLGAHRVELYTEAYAHAFAIQKNLDKVLDSYVRLAEMALANGLQINAGHDLNQQNLALFVEKVPEVAEVSIGHALISEALYQGLEYTVKSYLKILTKT
jgi:pyridoxine 5-phosphate synthase